MILVIYTTGPKAALNTRQPCSHLALASHQDVTTLKIKALLYIFRYMYMLLSQR